MEQFLELFGDVTIGKVVVLICAGVFLWKCYGKVSGYFKEKSIRDYEQNKQIQEVIELSKNYPIWRKQSMGIQVEMNNKMQNDMEKTEHGHPSRNE